MARFFSLGMICSAPALLIVSRSVTAAPPPLLPPSSSGNGSRAVLVLPDVAAHPASIRLRQVPAIARRFDIFMVIIALLVFALVMTGELTCHRSGWRPAIP